MLPYTYKYTYKRRHNIDTALIQVGLSGYQADLYLALYPLLKHLEVMSFL